MISGIGIDIESIKNFKKSYKDKHFLDLIFTKEEIRYCQSKKEPYISFAGKFCAKEAVIKALRKTMSLPDIEVQLDKNGAPSIANMPNIHISLSHADAYAIAFVVVEK